MEPDGAICGTPLVSCLSSSHPCHGLLLSHPRRRHLPPAPPPLAGGARPEVFSNPPPHSLEEPVPELTAAPLGLFLAPLPCHLAGMMSPRSCSVAVPPASTGRPSYLSSAFSPASLTRVAAGKPVRAWRGSLSGRRRESAAELVRAQRERVRQSSRRRRRPSPAATPQSATYDPNFVRAATEVGEGADELDGWEGRRGRRRGARCGRHGEEDDRVEAQ
jgi:hypothetical protein